MRSGDERIPLVALVGPTGVGKTEVSLRVAERLGGEIVSADSRLLYRGMDIGTAKPSLEERSRVPHHLIDVADPDERWSLTIFQEAAAAAILDIHRRGKLPLLVGGTGQYVRGVIDGWLPPSQAPDPQLRAVLERWGEELGAEELHRKLGILDPTAAHRIQIQNMRRTIRALEVILATGRPFSEQLGRRETPYDTLQIGLIRPRAELYARIDARIDQMIANGLIDEVHTLLGKGYSPELNTLSAIGYREVIAFIHGKISLEEAVILMRRLTRRYVRQQANWFRLEDKNIHWFDARESVEDQICRYIMDWQGNFNGKAVDKAL